MEAVVLNGLGKKMRSAYLRGQVSKETVMAIYAKNKKEADSFSVFGYKMNEIAALVKETHNPLLKKKLQECLDEKKEKERKSSEQNMMNLEKLENFKGNACGVGLRKVMSCMRKLAKQTKDPEIKLLQLLLDTEFANLSAKQYKGNLKEVIYQRKTLLLYQLADHLDRANWQYGINDESGKNASYLVYVYLPNGVQLTWHCNEYDIYNYYPLINATWDGQVCMTMEKILTYIDDKYLSQMGIA